MDLLLAVGLLPVEQADYLITGKKALNPPQMTAKVQEYLHDQQWAARPTCLNIGKHLRLISRLLAHPHPIRVSEGLALPSRSHTARQRAWS